MKSSHIIITLFSLVVIVLSLVLYNAFNAKRNFVVLTADNYEVCFLLDTGYQYELTPKGFRYWGGKNSGNIEFAPGRLSSNVLPIENNGMKAGYQKLINKRIFEYEVSQNYLIQDTFVNAGRMPVNLVPYYQVCDKIKDQFKKHIPIFGESK